MKGRFVMENRKSVDQKVRDIRKRLSSRPDIFAHQGAIVESWREYNGRKLGPYFRLSYRDGGKQLSVYLGRSRQFANRIRKLLQEIQTPVNQQRELGKIRAIARAALRKQKKRWSKDLNQAALCAKGFEIRGWSGGCK
jgi:hypothetical protein